MLEITDSLTVEVQPSKEHEWLLSTQDVARGYGLSESGLRSIKSDNIDELEEGKHYLTVRDSDAQRITGNSKTRQVTMWTKRGVVRLGFFIKTSQAKQFRDWAEDYIIDGTKEEPQTPKLPTTYLEALEALIERERKLVEVKPKVEAFDAIRVVKQRNVDEFEEGKHFVYNVTNRYGVRGASKTTMWTKQGL